MPNVEMIWGINLPGTPRATSACRGTPLLYFTYHMVNVVMVTVALFCEYNLDGWFNGQMCFVGCCSAEVCLYGLMSKQFSER